MSHEPSWELYPCNVDGKPAVITVDLAFHDRAPVSGLDTVYALHLVMDDPGEHGMGTQAEAERLWPLEDKLIQALQAMGLAFVGRLRNHGSWQMTFYGPPGLAVKLSDYLIAASGPQDQQSSLSSGNDPEWSYYQTFLLPDPERWQWILDRRVVHQLQEQGDDGEAPRLIDHALSFESAAQRDAFLHAAEGLGFVGSPLADAELTCQITRMDRAALDHIHGLALALTQLGARFGGTYDGWGSPVVRGDGS